MNGQTPHPPMPGDELKQSRNGVWFAYGLRDVRETFKDLKAAFGKPLAEYTDADASMKAAYRWSPREGKWTLWACFAPYYRPQCHLFERGSES